jgi:polysaccharide export outer membrane protein
MRIQPALNQDRGAHSGPHHNQLGVQKERPAKAKVSCCLAAMLLPVLCALLAGCRSFPEAYSSAFTHFDAAAPGYATSSLQEGDVVSITFLYSTNFNTLQKIGLDGTLNLEGVGPVKAAGKTALQLQGELAALYKPHAKDDPITLRAVSTTAAVYVTGAVNHPGKIPLERPMTVVEAIMEAGGFEPYRANLSNVSVLRIENGMQRAYQLNLKHVLQGNDSTLFYLKPSDVVQVPVKTFNF